MVQVLLLLTENINLGSFLPARKCLYGGKHPSDTALEHAVVALILDMAEHCSFK